MSGIDVKVSNGDILLRVNDKSFSLRDLPKEALKILAEFDGTIIVELPDSYYLYFRRKDVRSLLEKLGES